MSSWRHSTRVTSICRLTISTRTKKPVGNGPVPAAGWIKELRVSDDGLWGRVDWTDTARDLIATKAYRYISPTLIYEKDSKAVCSLTGAALVHTPALRLTALASQEDTMDEDMTLSDRLAQMLGLDPGAADEDIIAAVQMQMDKSESPDPAKFVPIQAMQDALRDRNVKSATMSETKAKAKVKDAMDKGFISPGMRDWATALCQQDETSFDTFIAGAVPQFAHLMKPSHMSGPPPFVSEAKADQSDLAAAVCQQLGLKPGTLNS